MKKILLFLKKFLYPVPIESCFLLVPIFFYKTSCCSSKRYWLIFTWLIALLISRIILKIVLNHKGLILETRGEDITLKTKIYKFILKLFKKINQPTFYSFQNSLPKLPIPDLNTTIKRYLVSIRPLVDDTAYDKALVKAFKFENGIGKSLQKELLFKSWFKDNYVSDWWESFHYLKDRNALMYGTSIYISDNINSPTNSQSARAANLVFTMIQYRDNMASFNPIYLREDVPICVAQYLRMFNTTRIPGVEIDHIMHRETSDYIAVIHKGKFYKLVVMIKNIPLNSAEIEHQINEILINTEIASPENSIAALTSLNRTRWAGIRTKYFSSGLNKKSLDLIENSAFVLALDDEEYIYGLSSSFNEYGKYGKILLAGNGQNRYFDKSFNLCVGKNGKAGLLCEHTPHDGSATSNFFQECIIDDFSGYDESGKLKAILRNNFKVTPEKIDWDFSSSELRKEINDAYSEAVIKISSIDHQIAVHKDFSKGLMKKLKVSPDAFIQMAFQLAYYRQYKKFCLTYEPAMTRLFLNGRTEVIRSCSVESSSWVKSMENNELNKAERLNLFKKACKHHQKLCSESMFGYGVDRHLFALDIIAKKRGITSKFLTDALSEPFVLLTSHIPHNQTKKCVENKINFISAGGGFPPSLANGYSISYFPFNDDVLFLHVSSLKTFKETDSEILLKGIIKALSDIKNLFEE